MEGEIYYIKNKINGKGYIGQALKYVSKETPKKWGAVNRWRSHLREAELKVNENNPSWQKDRCVALNHAIRKYGAENFTIEVLCECTLDKMDDMEIFYIQKYNTIAPNGYNLTTGGRSGKDSEITRERKRQMRVGKKHSEETKKRISMGQMGNRRVRDTRKRQEDKDLPKYISRKREGDIITGYLINGYPIGTDKKKFFTKLITNRENPEQAFQEITSLLKDLLKKYPGRQEIECIINNDDEDIASSSTNTVIHNEDIASSSKDYTVYDDYSNDENTAIYNENIASSGKSYIVCADNSNLDEDVTGTITIVDEDENTASPSNYNENLASSSTDIAIYESDVASSSKNNSPVKKNLITDYYQIADNSSIADIFSKKLIISNISSDNTPQITKNYPEDIPDTAEDKLEIAKDTQKIIEDTPDIAENTLDTTENTPENAEITPEIVDDTNENITRNIPAIAESAPENTTKIAEINPILPSNKVDPEVDMNEYILNPSINTPVTPTIPIATLTHILLNENDLPISLQNAVLKNEELPVMKGNTLKFRKTRETKIESSEYDLPKYISIQKNPDKKIIGFCISKLRIIQRDGTFWQFKRVFTSPTQTMQKKNKMAIEFLDFLREKYAILE